MFMIIRCLEQVGCQKWFWKISPVGYQNGCQSWIPKLKVI